MANATLTIETVSPLHIGSGRPPLRREIDFAVFDQTLYVLDTDQVLEHILPEDEADPSYQQVLNAANLASFLNPSMLEANPNLVRYAIGGAPAVSELRPQTTTIHGQPYIPGSSIKGALRTAWLRADFERSNRALDARRLGERKEWAFRPVEATLMSPGASASREDPNYDLFRALQITDSQPFAHQASLVYNVAVVPAGQRGIPIDVEGVKPRQATKARLRFDDRLLGNPKLGWGDAAEQLRDLIAICQEQAIKRIAEERIFWTGRAQAVLDFYHDLADKAARLEPNACYLEIGWGSGWMSKTLGRVIRNDRPLLGRLMSKYRLTRGAYHDGDPFPKTRRAACNSKKEPQRPMGWVKLTVD